VAFVAAPCSRNASPPSRQRSAPAATWESSRWTCPVAREGRPAAADDPEGTIIDVPGSHGQGIGLFELQSPCGRKYYGHTGGTPGFATFVAGSRDGRRMIVIAVNDISQDALQSKGKYLDKLLCPR
jgi:hypothetical protein